MENTIAFQSAGELTSRLQSLGIHDMQTFMNFIMHIPYGRNSDRSNPELVLSEMKGTCSTKHALVKMVADENELTEIKLMLGIYKMNRDNTPNIGDELEKHGLKYIPEAHCYLKMNDEEIDLTSAHSSFDKIKDDLIMEMEISPIQTGDFKVHFHKQFIGDWIAEEKIQFSFDDIWHIREACIKRLSDQDI